MANYENLPYGAYGQQQTTGEGVGPDATPRIPVPMPPCGSGQMAPPPDPSQFYPWEAGSGLGGTYFTPTSGSDAGCLSYDGSEIGDNNHPNSLSSSMISQESRGMTPYSLPDFSQMPPNLDALSNQEMSAYWAAAMEIPDCPKCSLSKPVAKRTAEELFNRAKGDLTAKLDAAKTTIALLKSDLAGHVSIGEANAKLIDDLTDKIAQIQRNALPGDATTGAPPPQESDEDIDAEPEPSVENLVKKLQAKSRKIYAMQNAWAGEINTLLAQQGVPYNACLNRSCRKETNTARTYEVENYFTLVVKWECDKCKCGGPPSKRLTLHYAALRSIIGHRIS